MKRFVDILLSLFGVVVALMAVFTLGPIIETRWFPVYSKFKIIEMTEISPGQTQVRFEYTKRKQCEALGFSWYIGDPGAAFRQLTVIPADKDHLQVIRPVGHQISEAYVMDATPEQLRDSTFAEIFNRCHPLWLTRSVIYP